MRFSEFKRYIKTKEFKLNGELLANLEDLKIYHPENNKLILLVKDCRSYEKDGVWYIYPIAFSKKQVHIVCPYCGEIHSHGRSEEGYEGYRLIHCKEFRYSKNYYIESI